MNDKTSARLSFIINTVFVAVVVALVYLSFQYVISWVLPFLLAFCIVSVVHPLIRLIKKRLRINQKAVSLMVMLLIYAMVGTLIFLVIMQIVLLVQGAIQALPSYFEATILPSLNNAWDSVSTFLRELPPSWQEQISSIQGEVIQSLQTFVVNLSPRGMSAISRITSGVPSLLIGFIFTIMLSFFISAEYQSVIDFLGVQLPPQVKKLLQDLRVIGRSTLWKYVQASLTLMVITFVELTIGLLLLKTEGAVMIAAGIAVLDALPFFGTGAAMIPWGIVELLQGNYPFALGLLILYAVVTFIRNIIEPKVIGDKLGLNPIVSLSAIYLGFKLFGVLGMIVMPIVTQIAMELHRSGTIKLFREKAPAKDKPAEPKS